ncbi:unnamed protein product, partial [Symbiodinium microadriaticum]
FELFSARHSVWQHRHMGKGLSWRLPWRVLGGLFGFEEHGAGRHAGHHHGPAAAIALRSKKRDHEARHKVAAHRAAQILLHPGTTILPLGAKIRMLTSALGPWQGSTSRLRAFRRCLPARGQSQRLQELCQDDLRNQVTTVEDELMSVLSSWPI